MLSKKGFCGGLRATLIQDQKSMRNLDSNPLVWIRSFHILIPQFLRGDFFDSIDPKQTSPSPSDKPGARTPLAGRPVAPAP